MKSRGVSLREENPMPVIRFKLLESNAVLPAYQTLGSSGFDFYSVEKAILRPGEVVLVRTGLSAEIPEGFEIQVRARSGLAAKGGVFLVNGIGTINSGSRGEIKIIMSTCGQRPVVLEAGERIAQGVLARVEQAKIEVADELGGDISRRRRLWQHRNYFAEPLTKHSQHEQPIERLGLSRPHQSASRDLLEDAHSFAE